MIDAYVRHDYTLSPMQKTVGVFFREVRPQDPEPEAFDVETLEVARRVHKQMEQIVLRVDTCAHLSPPTNLGFTHITASPAAIKALRDAQLPDIEEISDGATYV